MMRLVLIAAILSLLAIIVSPTYSAAPDWENPKLFDQNKEEPHATFELVTGAGQLGYVQRGPNNPPSC